MFQVRIQTGFGQYLVVIFFVLSNRRLQTLMGIRDETGRAQW